MEQALRQGNEKLNADLERERHSKQQLETQLARLVHAIAEGRPCQCFMEESGDRERELKAITSELLEPGRDSLRATPDELRDFAISQLAKIRGLISHPESVDLARAVLAERGAHPRTHHSERRTSVSRSGQSRFFGEVAMARMGGAGGQNRLQQPQDSVPI